MNTTLLANAKNRLHPQSYHRAASQWHLLAVAAAAITLTACGGGDTGSTSTASDVDAEGRAKALAATSWAQCASEDQQCAFSGERDVRYGTSTSYVTFGLSNGTACSNTVFGDPVPHVRKNCWYGVGDTTTPGRIGWRTTWGRSMLPQSAANFTNLTLRSPVRTSAGGRSIRVRLSNLYGSGPMTVNEVHAALKDSQSTDPSAIVASTDRVLTFNGSRIATIPAGAELVSDAVTMNVPASTDVMISMFFASVSLRDSHTSNVGGLRTQAVNGSNSATLPAFNGQPGATSYAGWYSLAGVEVGDPVGSSAGPVPSLVALGDSITDGALTTTPFKSWPDMLAVATKGSVAVANAGIGSNQLISNGTGLAGLTRFDREGLDRPDVVNKPYVLVMEGINDIQISNKLATDVIEGYKQLIAKAKAKGFKVYGGTLTPWYGWNGYTEARETQRQQVNSWIRSSGAFDGVVDFEAALIEPGSSPAKQRASCYADGIHPNENGYKVMGTLAAHVVFGTAATADQLRCN